VRKIKNTLETSGEDAKLHSKQVEKMQNYTRNKWRRCKTTLETSVGCLPKTEVVGFDPCASSEFYLPSSYPPVTSYREEKI
jgi:hypothetical protein